MSLPACHPGRNAPPDADACARDGRAPIVLGVAWTLAVLFVWLVCFAGSMRAHVSSPDALDLYGYFFPKYVHASAELAAGRLPLWNPYEYGGLPFLGTAQPGALYPPRALAFALLPPTLALHAFMVGHYLLLGAGAWMLLRTLGLGRAGSAFGVLVVALQPLLLNGHYHPLRLAGFTWVPLVLAAFVRAVERPGPGPVLALALAATLQVYAGYPEYAVDTALALVVLLPFVARRARDGVGRSLAAVAIAAVIALGLTALQWAALIETMVASARPATAVPFLSGLAFDPRAFGAGVRGWVGAISTFGYLPALGWLLVFVGLVAPRTPSRFAMLALWVFASVVFSPPLRAVPPFSLFRTLLCWTSILYVPLALLGGHGFERLVAWMAGARLTLREWAVGAVVTAAILALAGPRTLAWLAAAGALAVLGRRARGRALVTTTAALVAVTFLAIVTWVPPRLPAGLRHRWDAGQVPYPRLDAMTARAAELRRACGAAAEGRILSPPETLTGIPVAGRLRVAQGYPESLPPAAMTRLLDAAGLAPASVLGLDWARLADAGPILRLLDVSCVVVPAGNERTLAALGYAGPGGLADGRQVWVRSPRGRAWVVPRGERVRDGAAALAAVTAPGFDPGALVVLEGDRAGPSAAAAADARAVVVEEEPGRLLVDVAAPAGGWLVVGEGFLPGWRAEVDGVAVPVARADAVLLAVPLEPGARRVRLRYRPRGFAPAVGAGVIALLALGAGAWRWGSSSRRRSCRAGTT